MYSEQDLKYAKEFREEIHKEALAIVRKTHPNATKVIDRHPVEDYFQENWEYPGKMYTIVAIPYGYKSRQALVDTIVRDTLSGRVPKKKHAYTQELRDMAKAQLKLTNQLDAKPDGYEELFTVEIDQKCRSFRAVGIDAEGRYILEHYKEYNLGSATGSTSAYYVLTDLEYGRYARLALINGQLKEDDYYRLTAQPQKTHKQEKDPFYLLLGDYTDLVIDYCIINDKRYCGYASHKEALRTAFAGLDGDWDGDPDKATCKSITTGERFLSERESEKLNYRKAFLCPPNGSSYTDSDFEKVNAALFPNGTESLEVYEWTTDWSDYFDEGHEWWGTLCLTVYDKTLERFVVIMASATD